MANYYSTIKTNYFRVKDEEGFINFMNHVHCIDDEINLFAEEKDGVKLFAFGSYGTIAGYFETEDELLDCDDFDESYDNFIKGLQKHIADDDFIMIVEVGHEKLRCITGIVSIITTDSYEYETIESVGLKMAQDIMKKDVYSQFVF